jgi:hypothetical protein
MKMKTYKSSDLTHKRAEVLKEARIAPVIIAHCRTNGDIMDVFVLTHQPAMSDDDVKKLMLDIKKR